MANKWALFVLLALLSQSTEALSAIVSVLRVKAYITQKGPHQSVHS